VSPSEWPAKPRGCAIATPPSRIGRPFANWCALKPMPTRISPEFRVPSPGTEESPRPSRGLQTS
jgi:hypothetical protein